MSVPTHNLYDYVHQVLENKFWIRYFHPYGSKDLNDLIDLYTSESYKNDIPLNKRVCTKIFPEKYHTHPLVRDFQPIICCYDQEPLFFDLYTDENLKPAEKSGLQIDYGKNLRYVLPEHCHKKWILLHSELNSPEVQKYNDSEKFICAYWWSHAMIARDWYRFAQYDNRLQMEKNNKKNFLIYARDDSGTRKYRNDFLDKIIANSDLQNKSQIGSFTPVNISSKSSAVYNIDDFVNTDISIVLETVFDQRIHLTEKTLRPIAVGHPFILASGPGSLSYLRSYGFRTFSPYIDETYDTLVDPFERLTAIINEMYRISKLDKAAKQLLIQECRQIALHNKKLFFSETFLNKIRNELKKNVFDAYNSIKDDLVDHEHGLARKEEKIANGWPGVPTDYNETVRKYKLALHKHFQSGGTIENFVPPDLD